MCSISFTTEYFVDETDGFSRGQIANAIEQALSAEREGDSFDIELEDFMGEESTLRVEVCASWDADAAEAVAVAKEKAKRIRLEQALRKLQGELGYDPTGKAHSILFLAAGPLVRDICTAIDRVIEQAQEDIR